MDNLPILSYQRQRVYRATFDTNVFVRAVLGTDNVANALISLWLDESFILVLPPMIIAEVQDVLSRRDLIRKHRYAPETVDNLIHLLKQDAAVGEIPFSFGLCRDMSDDALIDCAIHERVQFLVSYDNDLLDDAELKQSLFEHGIEIVEPLAFLEKIREAEINEP